MSATTHRKASSTRRTAEILTLLIVVLAIVASAGGLFIPDLYRETCWVLPQIRGQDLVTLLAAVGLAVILIFVRRGSARGEMLWIGLLGYIAYTYTGAAFSYILNRFFLIYVALFSFSIFTLVAAVSSLDVGELVRRFSPAANQVPSIVFLLVFAFMLSLLWLSQIIPFLTAGAIPRSVQLAGNGMIFVYVLDLGVEVPLALLAAVWLWRRLPWGYVLAGVMMIKATTMGLALLSMTLFAVLADQPAEAELALVWALLAVGSLGVSVWFFRGSRSRSFHQGNR